MDTPLLMNSMLDLLKSIGVLNKNNIAKLKYPKKEILYYFFFYLQQSFAQMNKVTQRYIQDYK